MEKKYSWDEWWAALIMLSLLSLIKSVRNIYLISWNLLKNHILNPVLKAIIVSGIFIWEFKFIIAGVIVAIFIILFLMGMVKEDRERKERIGR